MVTVTCPECDRDIDFDLASDEDWAHNPCLEITDMVKTCDCELSDEQVADLEETAIEAANTVHVEEG